MSQIELYTLCPVRSFLKSECIMYPQVGFGTRRGILQSTSRRWVHALANSMTPTVTGTAQKQGKFKVCVCLLLQDLLQSCLRGGGDIGGQGPTAPLTYLDERGSKKCARKLHGGSEPAGTLQTWPLPKPDLTKIENPPLK